MNHIKRVKRALSVILSFVMVLSLVTGFSPVEVRADEVEPESCECTNITSVEAKEATCEEAGNSAYWKCTDCGKLYEDEAAETEIEDAESVIIEATGHEYSEIVAKVEATCEESGTKAHYTCNNCDKVFVDDEENEGEKKEATEGELVIEATGHTYAQEWTKDEIGHWYAATCGHTEEKGSYGTHVNESGEDNLCDVCGYEMAAEECEHEWGEGEVTTEPTCTEAGEKTYTCSNCEETKTEEISATGHEYSEIVAKVEATCEESGTKAHYTCNNCDDVFVDDEENEGEKKEVTEEELVIEATGHTYAQEWTKDETGHWYAATCEHTEEKGSLAEHVNEEGEDNLCDVCGYEMAVETCEHENIQSVEEKEATCEEAGNSAYWKCTECGKKFSDAEGTEEITDETTVVIPATGHSLTPVSKQEATCTAAGYEAYWTCDECEKMFSDAEGENEITEVQTIEKHTRTHVEAKEATCEEAGNSEYWECECGKLYADEAAETEIEDADSVIIPATGHTYSELVDEVPATCTVAGTKAHYTCDNCDDVFVDDEENDGEKKEVTADELVIPATGHEWSEEWLKDETGHWHAAICEHTDVTSEVEEHTYGEWTVTKPATETEEGSKERSCTVCEYKQTEVVPVVEVKAPEAPTGLAVEIDTAKSVKLTWNEVEGADGYIVYRSEAGKNSFTYAAMTSSGDDVTVRDTKIVIGTTYEYKVFAYVVNSAGKKLMSKGSSTVSIKAGIASATGLKAVKAGKNAVKLTWDKAENADGYIIYRQVGNGKFEYLWMVSGTSYTDTKASDTEYNFYRVYAYKKIGDKRILASSTSYVYAKGGLVAVGSLKASSLKTGVKLTWTASAGADGYIVYGRRGGTSDTKFIYVGMTKNLTYTDIYALKDAYNFYRVYPYYMDSNGKRVMGPSATYVYGKKK